MTGGSDIRLKIRAVFLAFVMVVSVFGATVAFSGTAAAENATASFSGPAVLDVNAGQSATIDTISINDTDSDGNQTQIDQIDIAGVEPNSNLTASELESVSLVVNGTPIATNNSVTDLDVPFGNGSGTGFGSSVPGSYTASDVDSDGETELILADGGSEDIDVVATVTNDATDGATFEYATTVALTGAFGGTNSPENFSGSVSSTAVNSEIDVTNPDTLTVIKGAAADDGDSEYPTIQTALDDANAGDTIDIAPGTFSSSSEVTVDVSGVTLEGPNAGTAGTASRSSEALIEYNESGPSDSGSAINITASNVTVNGLQIESEGQNGIAVNKPVDNIVIKNNRITKVDGGTFGSNSGDRATANGITFGLPRDGTTQNVTGAIITDNEISGITTQDLPAGDDRTSANGIQILTRENAVQGMVISDNTISNAVPGVSGDSGEERARGVVVNVGADGPTAGAATGFVIDNNDISGLTGNGTGASDAVGIALFETKDVDPFVGPKNFEITNNVVSNATNEGGPTASVFVGGYNDLGDNHIISGNNLEAPVERFNGPQRGFNFAAADGLTVTDNDVSASGDNALKVGRVSGVTGNTISSTTAGVADVRITRTDVTPSGVKSPNERVKFVLNENDVQTTNPYGVEVTPTDVTVGNTETVEGQILGRDSNNPRKSSVDFLIVDANNDTADAADSFDGDVSTDSSTNSNSFSTLVQFSEVGNFGLVLDSETSDPRANISSLYAINNFSTDPASPTFENSTSVSGQIVNGAGDGVDVGTITVIRPNDNTGSSTSTTSDGSFQFTVSGVDAGEFGAGTSSDEVFETFTVDPQQANVTLETAGGNNAGFSEDYTITVQDGSGNAFDFTNNYDGYVNVTGEFNSVSPTTDAGNNGGVDSDNDGVTDYYRVVPNSTGVIEFTATPNASADSVTATLENNGNNEGVGNTTAATNDGLEEVTGPTSYDAPDQVGSASAAISSAGNLTVNLVRPGDGDITATQSETIEIEALGADGQPADGSSGNDLANVTISLSGPGVDAEQTLTSDNSANFTVTADQAGTVTADVTAVENNGTEFTETVNVTVTGDKIVSVTPTDPDIDNTSDVTVEVTNADDTPVNSREVLITSQGNATFEVGSVTGVQQIAIDGANNQVVVDTDTDGQVEDASGSSTVVDNSLVVNNGLYTATNVTFSSPGDINVTVDRDTTAGASVRAQSVGAIATQGVDEYEIQSDISPLVASADEQVNFTVTDSAGAEVNGSTLNEFLGNGEFTVTQDGGTDVTTDTPETVDTDSDGTDDTIRVNVRPINASQAVNVSVATADGGQTGDSNVSVAAPQVNVAGLSSASGSLTERVATELTVTVENPRTGDRLSGTDLQAQVINGTAEFSSVSDFSSDENSTTALNVGDGNATFDVLAYDGTAEDFAVTISAKSSDSETDYFGDTTLDVEPMQVSVSPQEIVIGNQRTIDIGVQDANGNALANRRVDIAGAGVSIENAATDSQGTVTVTAQPQATGTIDIAVDSDAEIESGGATPPRVGSGSDPAATIEANISAVSSTQLAVNAGTLSPDTVSDNSTVQHTLEFTVEDLSADGNADDFTITLPASVSATNVADVTVTDGDGNNVAISSSASLADANGGTNNQLTFSVSPDSGNTSVVTVNSTFSVEFPDVQNDTTADINATVSDSTRGTAGATVATVTIQDQNATQQQPVATVTFDDKTVQNGTSNITVESAEFGGGEYNIVVHQASDTSGDGTIQAGEIGTKIGESDALPNGTASNVTVDIGKQVASNDNVSQLTQNQTLVAMLHTTNTSDGDNITHASNIKRGGTPVFDQAEIIVEQQPQGLDRFDRNGDGSISGTEVLGAIDAFENGQIGGTDVLQVIEAFEQGTVPSQLN